MASLNHKDCLEKLSICTVCFNHYQILYLNFSQLARRNKKVRFDWLLVDNSNKGDSKENVHYIRNFKRLDGVQKPRASYATASYHHGLGLNKCIAYAQTRFVLVIDPDFFIVREEALFEMITYMKRRGLGLLGVPWHPRHFIKYRDFPCLHCLMIDTNLIPRNLIDFQPIYEHGQFSKITNLPIYKSSRFRVKVFKTIEILDKILMRLGISLLSFQKRSTIGRSMDTGARIYYRYYSHRPCIHELLRPVKHNSQNASASRFRDRLDKCLDLIMPAFLRLDPGGYGQCKSKFLDANPETTPEEFCWNSKYFGFHLRLFPKDATSQHKMLNQLEDWIS